MAVCMVSGRESEQELVESHLMLKNSSGYHPLSWATIPHCRFTHLAKIKESATRQAMLPSVISPPF
jgi:hypothetical protein